MKRYLLGGALLIGAALLVWGGKNLWYGLTGPAVPAVDTNGVDWRVAQLITAGRSYVRRHAGSADAWGQLGRVFRVHEFEAQSNACFQRAEQLNPRDPQWPYLLAKGLRSSDPDAAESALRRAVRLGGSVTAPQLMLAEILVDTGQSREAELLLQDALKREPGNPRALWSLGRIAMDAGDMRAALDRLTQSAATAPAIRGTHTLLAQVYGQLGQPDEAARENQIAEKLPLAAAWPDPYQEPVTRQWVGLAAGLTRAYSMWEQGSRTQTVAILRNLVKDYPQSDRAQFSLGDRLNRLGEFAEAEGFLRQAVRIDPSFARARFELGYSVHQQGKLVEAVDQYREALRIQPDYSIVYYNLSYALEAQGLRGRAIEAARDAIRYEPGFAQAHEQLGKLLLAEGKTAEAHSERKRAEELTRSGAVTPLQKDEGPLQK